jgi:hypothetical protein
MMEIVLKPLLSTRPRPPTPPLLSIAGGDGDGDGDDLDDAMPCQNGIDGRSMTYGVHRKLHRLAFSDCKTL